MAQPDESRFNLRLRQTPPGQEPPGPGTAKTFAPVADTPYSTTGGRFANPAGVLAFLSAVAGAGLADSALCRRSPEGAWWAEVPAPWAAAAHLVWIAGGRPFAGAESLWTAVPLAGESLDGAPAERLELTDWEPVELAELLAATPLQPRRLASAAVLEVVVPGALGRWVLRRALALGIQVSLAAALRRPLCGEGPESGVLWLRLRVERGVIPVSLIRAVSSLPYTLVAQAVGLEDSQFLVDIRYRPPLAQGLLAGWLPAGESWVLGAADVGHWRLRLTGAVIDGTTFLEAPTLPIRQADAAAAVHLPAPLPVRLVVRRDSGTRIDAVLLDEAELGWLRLFLAGRPLGERAFLLPGPERYLLLAPGGLPGMLPFGTPLTRIGPGGLYIETGLDFYPPLPEGARQQAFALAEGKAVAVVSDGAYGFENGQMLPAWTLWAGQVPPVQEGLSPGGRQLLARISESLREAEAGPMEAAKTGPSPSPFDPGRRTRLLAEAQRAELAGELVRAAELLEAAGEPAGAGRLYERAAAQAHRR